MNLIRCSGHRFQGVKPKNPFGIINEFKCEKCGLLVHTRDAADFLEGKVS